VDCKWCIHAVGASELDFRFSVLQPVVGLWHFKGGISKLKQVTSRVHQDIQRFIIGVIADVPSPDFVIALWSLMDFHYSAQAYVMDEDDLNKLERSLADFHQYKDSILAAGARHGSGNRPISNWHIPKLELMQNVIPSIRRSGVTIQWTVDVTEHANITEIKDPTQQSNNNNYDPQICQHLDRKEKLRRFELATTLHQLALDIATDAVSTGTEDEDNGDKESELENDKHSILFPGLSRPITNYFTISRHLVSASGTVPTPLCSFSIGSTTFHLTSKPSIQCLSVQEAADLFQLTDLPSALSCFVIFEKDNGPSALAPIGGHHRSTGLILPFNKLQVWFKFRIQGYDFHIRDQVLPAQTLFCAPPSTSWPFGRYDTALAATSPNSAWPDTGLQGTCQPHFTLIKFA